MFFEAKECDGATAVGISRAHGFRGSDAPSGLASTSFLLTALTPSMIPSAVGACCAATAWISTSVVCLASASELPPSRLRLSFVTKSSSAAWMLASRPFCP